MPLKQHPKKSDESSSLLNRPEYSVPALLASVLSPAAIVLTPVAALAQSISSSESTEATGKSTSLSKDSESSSEPPTLSQEFKAPRRPAALTERREVSRKLSLSWDFEKDPDPTVLIPMQDDIALVVEGEKFPSAKNSSYVLQLNKWKYNTDDNEQSKQGIETIHRKHTSTVFKVDAVVTRSNAGTNTSSENFVTKVGSATCSEKFQ